MQFEQPGPAELLEKKHKGSTSTTVTTGRLEKRHKGNDIGMVDDIVAVPGGQQVHTVLEQFDAAKTEQDSVTKALVESPDTKVTLSATVTEKEEDTRADVQESTRLAMTMCQDQISCKKHFAHAWPRWPMVWSMPEVSRLMHMNNV